MTARRQAAALMAGLALSGCGLAGRDGYGRPVACPEPGAPKVPHQGNWSCIGAVPTLSGTQDAQDPRIQAQLAEAAERFGGPVAYTDGTITHTYVPSF